MNKEKEKENLYYWYHYDNRGNPNQNYDDDPEHFENWKKENEGINDTTNTGTL